MLAVQAAIYQLYYEWYCRNVFQFMSIKMHLYGTSSPHQISVFGQSSPAPVATDPAHCIWKQAYISQELFHRDSQAEK